MRVRILHEAEADAREAAQWYENRQQGLGGKFFEALGDGLQEIERHPQRFPTIAGGGKTREIRRLLIGGFPYKIIYEVLAKEVVVLSVVHAKRKPGSWRKRTP